MGLDMHVLPDGRQGLVLSPEYQPAETDYAVVVRFIGNTAEVKEVAFMGAFVCSPGQLLVAAERLKGLALAMEARDQMRKAQAKEITVAGRMPPEGVFDRLTGKQP